MSHHRREALLLTLAVGVIGMTFGVLADAAGFGLPKIVVMSAFVFTGASQFAAVSVVESGGSGSAAVGSALLLAARNALYGPVVGPLLPPRPLGRLASSHFVIDETTAMASVQDDEATARDAFWWTAVLLWVLWNLGTVAGAVLGSVIGDPAVWGLDAAFPAAFLSLLVSHVRQRPGQVAAVVGAALALMAMPVTPAGVPLLVAVIAVVPGWLVRRGRRVAG